MIKLLALIVALALIAPIPHAKSNGGKGGGPNYGGAKHSNGHGGSYRNGKGSAHKGGTYKNDKTGDRYGKHN